MNMLGKWLIFIPFLFGLQNYAEDSSRLPDPVLKEKFTVVLDAGHGGHDPGNLGNGYLEKNIALRIVLEAGKILEKDPNINVVYTRKDDTFVDLYVRGEIANKAKADLFVSVHCDSHTSNAHGAGTFVLGLHANKQNFEIAKKENSVIYLEDNYEARYAEYDINSPESVIGLTIMQEEFLDQSIMLAKMMQDRFAKKLKRNDRKVKQAGFIVLHQTFMPSVLIEAGFLTNKNEGTYLNSRRGQSEMGKAIAEAILNYKEALQYNFDESQTSEDPVITPPPTVAEVKSESAETNNEVATKEAEVAASGVNTDTAKEIKMQVPVDSPSEDKAKTEQTQVKEELPVKEPEVNTNTPVKPKELETKTDAAKPKSNANITFKVQLMSYSAYRAS